MAQPLDASQFEEVSPQTVQGPIPASKPAPQPLDDSQFEQLPVYADGSSATAPINKSPVDAIDKLKLSLGNEAGNINYLKKRFQDVQKGKDGDLVVKDNGVWHRVDPKTFDAPDAWEATKIIANKIPSLAGMGITIGGQVGGAAAGAVAGPAGMIAGGGAGSAAGEAMRTSLGRLVGTYEATPQQQVQDIGWEGLLGSGGEVVGMAVKPTFGMLKKSLSNINEYGSNFVKENLADFWGGYTGTGKEAVRRAMDAPTEVIGKANQAINAVGLGASPEQAKLLAGNTQDRIVKGLAVDSKSALQANYRSQQMELLKQVPDNFSADVGGMMTNVQQTMAQSGYGKMVGPKGNQRFALNSMDDMAQTMGLNSEQLPKIFGEKTESAMQEIAGITNRYAKLGTLNGKSGARQVLDLKRALGESFDEFFKDDVPAPIQRNAKMIKDQIDEQLGQKFVDHGVGPQYIQMNKEYATNKDIVDRLNHYVDKGQTEQVVKYLSSKTGANRMFKDEVASLASILGDSGQKRMNDIMDWEAAKGFMDFTPAKGGNSFESVKKTLGTVTQMGNPRVIGGIIDHGNQALDMLKSLPPKQVKQFLSDDKAVSSFTTPVIQAIDGQNRNIQQLLQSSGVVPGGGAPNGQ